MAKWAIAILLVLVFLGGGLWYFSGPAFNEFVRSQIETQGSAITSQTVKVKRVDIQLSKGAGEINGITINNPAGYKQANALSLGKIALDIDIASIAKQPIVIESFTISDLQAFVEVTKKGANFKDLLDQINQNLPKSSEPAVKNESGDEPKMRIDNLLLSDIGMTLDLTQLGNKVHQQTLPAINLGNVGGEQGLPVSKLGVEISKKIVDSIWQQAKKAQKQKLLNKAKEKLNKETDKLKQKAKDKLKDLIGNLGG